MKELLSSTELLLNHIYWFHQDFGIQPQKEHIGSTINWTDISDRTHDFLTELITTVTHWVYNKQITKEIVNERLKETGGDHQNAYTFLTTQAFSKFRPGHPQGQFGELLLFNFIQYFFKAAPLLRKQRITTSIGHERFGADAIHYKKEGEDNVIYLGESKCYRSDYQFRKAFETSLDSIVTTVTNFNKELELYLYGDFIEPELEGIARDYKAGKLKNVKFELICLVAYNETENINGMTETEIKQSIKTVIENRCKSLGRECFDAVDEKILRRINYIIFPIWSLEQLLDAFQLRVGSTT
ncbi:DUF1837 domain-containing protein [Fulvivirga ulvae]|uniref:HamA C-terminal domain-containing protein n=1 Tax=Fulvivirga ulvae TaxID=2904245 RepID=UPI001F3AC2A0|nr:DUF1837 domain-containing protein [Fulvivirga ulvae]UII32155.1 DUF1837 domain-containing protein [Fulvivirga ulvae]